MKILVPVKERLIQFINELKNEGYTEQEISNVLEEVSMEYKLYHRLKNKMGCCSTESNKGAKSPL